MKFVNLSAIIIKVLPKSGWCKYQVYDPETLDIEKNIVKINTHENKNVNFQKIILQWLDSVFNLWWF